MKIDRKLGRRRGQVRRRRAVALLVASSLLLMLTFLVAAQVPAETTSGSGQDAAAAGEAAETCPEGQREGEAEAESEGECEPPAETEPPVEESEEPAAEEPLEEAPAEEPPVEAAEAPVAGGESGGAPPVTAPQQAAAGGSRHAPAVVAGAPLEAKDPRGRGGSNGAPSGDSRARGHRGGGAARSGGTAAAVPQPRRWGWSGPWAIPWPIVACESGGDYGALNASSGAGGAYQILPSTWRSYGGRGLPQTAPPSEQDRIAARIWADAGPAAWVCAQDGGWFGAGLEGAFGPLPDPLPPARRLDVNFVALLSGIARERRVDWALLLAIVRLGGGRGPVPSNAANLRSIAARVASLDGTADRVRARLLFERPARAQRLMALVHYNRAIGRLGLVAGLEAVKDRLARRVLASRRLRVYAGGRADVAAGRVDVRVLTLLLYFAQRYRSVTVTSLVSGHSFLTTAGRPSLHPFGRAVDISALNGKPIFGHQQPGGLTERALRRILLLPRELQPQELISLFSLGGPSFAAADHADHIHVGF